METWRNDRAKSGRRKLRIGFREADTRKRAEHALDRAYRLLDWLDRAAVSDHEAGLQWLPGRQDGSTEVKYEVVAKDRDAQIWIERVSHGEPVGIVIEDGTLAQSGAVV